MIKGQDGTWYLAMRTRKVTSKEEYLVFLGGEKGGKNATEVTEKELCDGPDGRDRRQGRDTRERARASYWRLENVQSQRPHVDVRSASVSKNRDCKLRLHFIWC